AVDGLQNLRIGAFQECELDGHRIVGLKNLDDRAAKGFLFLGIASFRLSETILTDETLVDKLSSGSGACRGRKGGAQRSAKQCAGRSGHCREHITNSASHGPEPFKLVQCECT